eukprot:2104438-Prymnesium_polylepis.2
MSQDSPRQQQVVLLAQPANDMWRQQGWGICLRAFIVSSSWVEPYKHVSVPSGGHTTRRIQPEGGCEAGSVGLDHERSNTVCIDRVGVRWREARVDLHAQGVSCFGIKADEVFGILAIHLEVDPNAGDLPDVDNSHAEWRGLSILRVVVRPHIVDVAPHRQRVGEVQVRNGCVLARRRRRRLRRWGGGGRRGRRHGKGIFARDVGGGRQRAEHHDRVVVAATGRLVVELEGARGRLHDQVRQAAQCTGELDRTGPPDRAAPLRCRPANPPDARLAPVGVGGVHPIRDVVGAGAIIDGRRLVVHGLSLIHISEPTRRS